MAARGQCEFYCSSGRYCGVTSAYQETDCRGCAPTQAPTAAPTVAGLHACESGNWWNVPSGAVAPQSGVFEAPITTKDVLAKTGMPAKGIFCPAATPKSCVEVPKGASAPRSGTYSAHIDAGTGVNFPGRFCGDVNPKPTPCDAVCAATNGACTGLANGQCTDECNTLICSYHGKACQTCQHEKPVFPRLLAELMHLLRTYAM